MSILKHVGHLAMAVVFALTTAPQAATAATTHVIGLGVCPPWKGMPASVCSDAVAKMTGSLAKRYDVPTGQVHSLTNQDATVSGLETLIGGLPALGSDDRIVLYMVLHNGAEHGQSVAAPDNDVLVFWSQDDPGAVEFALFEHKWMRGKDFATLVHGIGAGTLVVIMEACHSGALALDVLHDTDAVVTTVSSAHANQLANLSADMSQPLFSGFLEQALADDPQSTLADVLSRVSTRTARAAVPLCQERKKLMAQNNGYTPDCNQVPDIQDPHNLLPQL